jgi:hypothetical protein
MTQADLTKGLKIGDVIEITTLGGEKKYYKIKNRDNIIYRDSHDELAAGATESYASVTELNPPIGQIYQFYEIELERGNVKVYLKQPAATNRFGTNKSPTGGFLTDENCAAFIDLWVVENYEPNIQIVNDTNVAVTPILRWYGWRYSTEEVSATEKQNLVNQRKFTPVTMGWSN